MEPIQSSQDASIDELFRQSSPHVVKVVRVSEEQVQLLRETDAEKRGEMVMNIAKEGRDER